MNAKSIEQQLLHEIASLDSLPKGAYNIRENGKSAARATTENVNIVNKIGKSGIDIFIAAGTHDETIYIPVVISESGIKENVYNDFIIGPDCDITIVAGCGISNCGSHDSQHDGIHSFFVGERSRVKYVEKHYGEGTGRGKRVMNPQTIVNLSNGAHMEMETLQIAGIDDSVRDTTVTLGERATFELHDNLMTDGDQKVKAKIEANLDGDDCSCNIISRGVARGNSYQDVVIKLSGNARCAGHAECDSILMDNGLVVATPQLKAACVDASLVHEAAIGKIAGEQLTKLMSLGLSEHQAEEEIIRGFLH